MQLIHCLQNTSRNELTWSESSGSLETLTIPGSWLNKTSFVASTDSDIYKLIFDIDIRTKILCPTTNPFGSQKNISKLYKIIVTTDDNLVSRSKQEKTAKHFSTNFIINLPVKLNSAMNIPNLSIKSKIYLDVPLNLPNVCLYVSNLFTIMKYLWETSN